MIPHLYHLPLPVGHVFLWEDPDGLTLVDSGAPGSAPEIAAAVRSIGRDPADVRRLVLTHFHVDHTGGAAEIAAWGDVTVCAHRADAPVISGERAGPLPQLLEWERPLFEQVSGGLQPEATPVRVDRELDDGDILDFGGGAIALGAPGHTPGSVAIHLPVHRMLFTGDTVARGHDGAVMLGVFNADPPLAAESFRRLAGFDVDVACFGHGDPVTHDAAGAFRQAVATLPL